LKRTADDTDRPGTKRRGSLVRPFLAGVALTAVAIGAAAFASARTSINDGGATRFEHAFAKDYLGTVEVNVTGPADDTLITLRWGQLRTTFIYTGPQQRTYLFERGVTDERQGALIVTADHRVQVSFAAEPATKAGIDVASPPWTVIPFAHGTVPMRPANADSTAATASVDETLSYGGPVPGPGIGLRSGPNLQGTRVGAVHHGENYPADCWTTGETITNSNWSDPSDDLAAYTSDVWWHIDVHGIKGYVSDVWFARQATTGKMNLAECGASS